jgi:hypothetical protein
VVVESADLRQLYASIDFAGIMFRWKSSNKPRNTRYRLSRFQFSSKEIGAGIGLGPNAAKALYLVGLDHELAEISSSEKGPHSHIWMRMRKWDTGSFIVPRS